MAILVVLHVLGIIIAISIMGFGCIGGNGWFKSLLLIATGTFLFYIDIQSALLLIESLKK